MNAAQIKNELRESSNDDLDKRRKLVLLSAAGLVDFSVISLYQTGVIKKLPDLPLEIFDTNKVNASDAAYRLGAPDGTISSLVYAAVMVLASAKGTETSGRKPVMDVALGAAVAANAVGAVSYLSNMIFKQKKICLYCVTGAAINIASVVIVAPVVIKSIRKLFR